jgi:5-methylcytosine-specific restriction endonuclease McrA
MNNPDRAREAERRWKQENPDKARGYTQAYRDRDPERAKAIFSRWLRRYPEKNAARIAKYRVAREQACPPWVDHAEIAKVYAEAVRLSQETGIPHEVDHVIPLQHRLVCGLHVPWNLRAIPATENQRKSNKLLLQPHEVIE